MGALDILLIFFRFSNIPDPVIPICTLDLDIIESNLFTIILLQ